MTHGGGSWRSGSAATGLPRSRRATRCSSSARTAIADSAIAARNAASKPAASSGGAPTAATSGARKAGSIIATGSGSTGAAASSAIARDGSRFPFDHFPGIIRLWNGRCGRASSGVAVLARKASRRCGCAAGSAAAPAASSIHFHAFHDEGEPSHDQSGNPRADSPLLLRRALEDRHHCQRTGRPPRHRSQRH